MKNKFWTKISKNGHCASGDKIGIKEHGRAFRGEIVAVLVFLHFLSPSVCRILKSKRNRYQQFSISSLFMEFREMQWPKNCLTLKSVLNGKSNHCNLVQDSQNNVLDNCYLLNLKVNCPKWSKMTQNSQKLPIVSSLVSSMPMPISANANDIALPISLYSIHSSSYLLFSISLSKESIPAYSGVH